MVPQHSDEFPSCKCLPFIPKRYPFTVRMDNISNPRIRAGKDWIVTKSFTPNPSKTIQKTSTDDMFVLLNVNNSNGTFTISY